MKHDWHEVERGEEWCKQCGTFRSGPWTKFDPTTGADLGKFYTYYEAGEGRHEVPEKEGVYHCPLLPAHFKSAIQEWLSLREEWGTPLNGNNFYVNADHSALLRRLLAGEKVFDEPPPLSHSYPNYGLMERGWDEPLEVWTKIDVLGPDAIVIDQHRWKILETIGEEEWIVTYLIPDRKAIEEAQRTGKEPKYGRADRSILSKTRWRVMRIGTRVMFHNGKRLETHPDQKSLDKLWRIERLPDATETDSQADPSGTRP